MGIMGPGLNPVLNTFRSKPSKVLVGNGVLEISSNLPGKTYAKVQFQ